MRRRFWVAVALTIPVVVIAMGAPHPGSPAPTVWRHRTFGAGWSWALATPVVLWGGWPFFVRGVQSVINRSLNMFTLIGLGVSVAYIYSVVAKIFPGIFPASFRNATGEVGRLFRGRGRHRHPGAPGPGVGTEGPKPDQRRHQGSCWAWLPKRPAGSRRTAPRKTFPWSRCRPATVCGCGPGKRCRWTAPSWRARVRWMNP